MSVPCDRFVQPLISGSQCSVCGFSKKSHDDAARARADIEARRRYEDEQQQGQKKQPKSSASRHSHKSRGSSQRNEYAASHKTTASTAHTAQSGSRGKGVRGRQQTPYQDGARAGRSQNLSKGNATSVANPLCATMASYQQKIRDYDGSRSAATKSGRTGKPKYATYGSNFSLAHETVDQNAVLYSSAYLNKNLNPKLYKEQLRALEEDHERSRHQQRRTRPTSRGQQNGDSPGEVHTSDDLEAQAVLLEKAGEAAEKRRDFKAAERHYVEAAEVMARARKQKRAEAQYKKEHPMGSGDDSTTTRRRAARKMQKDVTFRSDMDDIEVLGRVREAGKGRQDGGAFDVDDEEGDLEDGYSEDEEIDNELNRSLGKTLLSAREMHFRSDLVSADEQLLSVLGWSSSKQERAFDLFNRFTQGSPHMNYDNFAVFLTAQGISLKHAAPLFRAFDRMNHGTWLSSSDFVIGMAACLPTTPHRGAWLRIRFGALFRFYSLNGKRMSIDHLTDFIAESKATHPVFHFVHRTREGENIPLTDALDIATYLMGGRTSLNQTEFVAMGLEHGLPPAKNLVRFPFAV